MEIMSVMSVVVFLVAFDTINLLTVVVSIVVVDIACTLFSFVVVVADAAVVSAD